MSKNKTIETETNAADFINSYVEDEQKKKDSFRLIELMQEWSGCAPKIWGTTIVGFGSYHYIYASGHEGDAPLIGFSPRKAAFSLYVFLPPEDAKPALEQLGKFKMGKGCIYIKKLSDINPTALEKLCKAAIKYLKENYG